MSTTAAEAWATHSCCRPTSVDRPNVPQFSLVWGHELPLRRNVELVAYSAHDHPLLAVTLDHYTPRC